MKDLELAQAIRLKELEIKVSQSGSIVPTDRFDVTCSIVSPFNEKEVDKFFAHFEGIATVLNPLGARVLKKKYWILTSRFEKLVA